VDPVLVALILVPVVAFVAIRSYYSLRDPNQGMSTRCGDYLRMNHSQQVAVMRKVHVPHRFLEANVRDRAEACNGSPSGTPIGEPQG
jgi:hypothetical protein